jgi:hypothetical protein
MKKFLSKPGFEFMFSISFVAILCLPPMLMAQTQKDMGIKIVNGDTTVNGKKIRELSDTEKRDALKDINHLSGLANTSQAGRRGMKRMFFRYKDSTGNKPGHFWFKKTDTLNGMRGQGMIEDMTVKDSVGNVTIFRSGKPGGQVRDFAFKYRNNDETPGRMGFGMMPPRLSMMRHDRVNGQAFNYANTDKQGYTTRINFFVSEPEHEDLEKISGVAGGELEVTDLSLVPEFSSGKTILMFSLPAKTVADINLKDGEGKLLWNEKSTGGNFTKSFSLPLNGVYYLHIKQGHSVAVKKIVKDE